MSRKPVENTVDEALRRVRRAVADQRAEKRLASWSSPPPSTPGLERVQSALAALDTPPNALQGGRLRRAALTSTARLALSALRRLQGPERDLFSAMASALGELSEDVHRQKRELEQVLARSRTPVASSDAFSPLELHRRFADQSEAADRRISGYAQRFAGCTDVLDIGCGTGRFLSACQKLGVGARGVDHDPSMVEASRAAGANAIQADALSFLRGLPNESLDGIFSAQFVEHLGPGELVELIAAARDKLQPNSTILVETLNPECLQVLYRWFWLDPTHQRLVHPWLLEQLLATVGFTDIETHVLPPSAGALRIPPLKHVLAKDGVSEFDDATEYLSDLLYSGPDYFTVARR